MENQGEARLRTLRDYEQEYRGETHPIKLGQRRIMRMKRAIKHTRKVSTKRTGDAKIAENAITEKEKISLQTTSFEEQKGRGGKRNQESDANEKNDRQQGSKIINRGHKRRSKREKKEKKRQNDKDQTKGEENYKNHKPDELEKLIEQLKGEEEIRIEGSTEPKADTETENEGGTEIETNDKTETGAETDTRIVPEEGDRGEGGSRDETGPAENRERDRN